MSKNEPVPSLVEPDVAEDFSPLPVKSSKIKIPTVKESFN